MLEEPGHVCWDCLSALEPVEPPYCAKCGDPVEGDAGVEFFCSSCARNEPPFVSARSAFRYRGPMKSLVQALKYGGMTNLAADMGTMLAGCAAAHFADAGIDSVEGVPLHPRRQRHRTYNQSALLAAGVAGRLGVPLLAGGLVRLRDTASQTFMNMAKRRDNVRGAFAVTDPSWVEGRRILLVDDVMTTGATVSECAGVLEKAGAAGVYVATVARG